MLKNPNIKKVIAVASGKGGVGKSTLSVNLALSLKQLDYKVGLLDADIYGPSLPQLMNTQLVNTIQVYENQLIQPIVQHDILTMSMGYLMKKEEPAIWRGPIISAWIQKLFKGTDWGVLDYLIVDLPPGTGDIPLTVAQKIPVTGIVFITTPQIVALSDVRKSIAMFKKVRIPLLGIVENMSYYQCTHCNKIEYLFGKEGASLLGKEYGMTVLERLPLHQQICIEADRGQFITTQEPNHPISKKFKKIAETLIQILDRPNESSLSRIPIN